MKIVVGLGNPGRNYHGTRHNVGFAVIDSLALSPSTSRWQSRFQSQVAEFVEGGEKLLLLKPEMFMNLSGRAVLQAVDFYNLPLLDLLVVCDDFNLPLGKLRIRTKGSHGGQNGLRNIQEQLGTDVYSRLRIGVGQPEPGDAVDFVLSKLRPGERQATEDAVALAAKAALVWVRHGVEAAMNRFNGTDDPDNKKAKPKKEKPGGTKPDQPANTDN